MQQKNSKIVWNGFLIGIELVKSTYLKSLVKFMYGPSVVKSGVFQ